MILSFDDSVACAITGVTYYVSQFMFPAVSKIPPRMVMFWDIVSFWCILYSSKGCILLSDGQQKP